MKYPQLFSPLDIGPITVANRVVFGAHFTMFTEPGGEAGEHEATIADLLSGRTEVISAVDTVVIRTHGLPNDELYFELAGRVPEVIRVGDAVAVRFIDRAIFDGHMAGRRL